MKIQRKALHDGDIILEEVEAEPVKGDISNLALVHDDKRWIVYDIPTGLLVVNKPTKREALDGIILKKLEILEARKTELYQKRISEFEKLRKL